MNTDGPPLSPGELAKALKCSRFLVDRAIHAGQIPALRLGRRWFVPRPVVAEMLACGRIADPRTASGSVRAA